ncbi:hypothetical protein MTO96_027679 [Rhipicephalus appendiculatus]
METHRLHLGPSEQADTDSQPFPLVPELTPQNAGQGAHPNKSSVSLTPTASPPASDEATSETGPPSSDRPVRRSRFGRIIKPPRRLIL